METIIKKMQYYYRRGNKYFFRDGNSKLIFQADIEEGLFPLDYLGYYNMEITTE